FMTVQILILVASLVFLGFSANYLVNASIRIARKWHVSEMFIGLTIVALGTSAPEIAVSAFAALEGKGDLSIGNVIGSNIFNLGFILGLVAIISPQIISKKMVYRDGLVLLSATLMVLFFMWDLKIVLWEGIMLLAALVSYLSFLWIKKDVEINQEDAAATGTWKDYLIFIVSLLVLVKSSEFTVSSATYIAEYFKISAWAIGATIVAAGTSLPELATSIIATLKKKFGLSIGNVIGSDIFNTFGVIGISSVIAPIALDAKTFIFGFADSIFSVILLVATIILLLVFMRSGWKISRREGIIIFLIALFRMAFEVYVGKM
ncbi:MAG: calcium/sodium antiporter, partial [Clostridia bacterium]|nr:calcium/sodium antiporter [Clostridia bacterium]